MFRQCLAAALGRRRRLTVVAETPDLAGAILRRDEVGPDIVLAQLETPVAPPELDQLRELARTGCPVLVVSAARAVEVSQVLQAGARGYVDHTRELRELEHAIDQIYGGDGVVVVSSPEGGFLQDQGTALEHQTGLPASSLSQRELDVLRLVALGRTNSQIARELCITEHTAKGHLAKILGKLGLENRVQLAAYATRNRLAEPARAPEVVKGSSHQ